jgi:hypothetical protein
MKYNKDAPHLILIGGNYHTDLDRVKFIARLLAAKPGGTVKLRRTNMRENGDCTFEIHVWDFTSEEWQEVVNWLGLEHIDLRLFSPGLLI